MTLPSGQKPFINRRKLRVIRLLTVSLLILLSAGVIVTGIKLLYDSQQSAKPVEETPIGEPVGRIGGFALTSDGYVVVSRDDTLPSIEVATDPLSEGDKIEGSEIQKTGELLALFKKNTIAVETVIIYAEDYCVAVLPGTIRVLYTSNSDARTITSSLQSMMAVFTIEGKMPQEIDFRFDKPVIRYE